MVTFPRQRQTVSPYRIGARVRQIGTGRLGVIVDIVKHPRIESFIVSVRWDDETVSDTLLSELRLN